MSVRPGLDTRVCDYQLGPVIISFYPHVEFVIALGITYALVRGVYRDILIPFLRKYGV